MLKKYKPNGEIEFRPVYFNSTTKTVINHKFSLENAFQEILYRIDNWINEGSGWIVESVESQYINISTYRSLSGSSYVKLPVELGSPRKGLINIKNKDQKCFLWCHVRHINPLKEHSERITKEDKKLVKDLDYHEIDSLYEKMILVRLKKRTTSALMYFVTKMGWFFQNTFQMEIHSESSMDLLFVTDGDKLYYVYIKTLAELYITKQRIKTRNGFVEAVYSVLVIKMCWKTIKKIV